MARYTAILDPYDYVVIAAMLAISTSIGAYHACSGGKQRTLREFLLANREMGVFPVTMSMIASTMSAVSLLGIPAEIYINGIEYMIIGIGTFGMVAAAAFLYYPVFYHLKIISLHEYFELRFKSKGVRLAACLTFIFQQLMYMSVVLYAPCLALNSVTGFNVWASVFTVGSVCTLYTTLGGMKAVMWTDVFQATVMVAGLLAVIIKGCLDLGGLSDIWHVAEGGERANLFNFDPDPTTRHTFWNLSIGGTFTWLIVYGVNQAVVQRAMTCPNLKATQLAILLTSGGLVMFIVLSSICGLIIYSFFRNCDPISNHDVWAPDQVLPFYVMETLSYLPAVPGLFIACIFSGSLSTISSGLNSLTTVTIVDLVRGKLFPNISEDRATLSSKILVVVYGFLVMLLALVASQLGSVLQAAISLFGMIGGPLLGIFTLGLFIPSCNAKGAVIGLFTGLAMQLWIGFWAFVNRADYAKPPMSTAGCRSNIIYDANYTGNTTTHVYYYTDNITTEEMAFINGTIEESRLTYAEKFYTLSHMWYGFLATFVVCLVGFLMSIATGSLKYEEVDPRTISPIVHTVKKWIRKNKCGLKLNKKNTGRHSVEITSEYRKPALTGIKSVSDDEQQTTEEQKGLIYDETAV